MTEISVVIPVGARPHHGQYLSDALESVRNQTHPADEVEVLIIDDMHGLPRADLGYEDGRSGYPWPCPSHLKPDRPHVMRASCDECKYLTLWPSPWRLGVAHAFNMGVAIASSELVFMLGADDRLLPNCLAECVRSYEKHGDGFHWVGVEYSDDRPNQYVPCGAAMVTKTLWRETGGFPTQSAVGASDAALISILMRHMPEKLICVNKRKPQYWYRSWDESETAHAGPWQGSILEVRHRVTELWEKPAWGRYA